MSCPDCAKHARDARRLRKGLRQIAGLPDHEAWWYIARDMALRIADNGATASEAKAEAIDEYDQAHNCGEYDTLERRRAAIFAEPRPQDGGE